MCVGVLQEKNYSFILHMIKTSNILFLYYFLFLFCIFNSLFSYAGFNLQLWQNLVKLQLSNNIRVK